MRHFDLDEQERIDKLKYFLRDWGKYIALLIVIVVIAYVSDMTWSWYKGKDALKTAILYEDFTQAVKSADANAIYKITDQMEKKYSHEEYTAMASMWAAKIAKDHNNNIMATKYLQFTINNAKDSGLVDIARLRLADIYIDERKFDLALRLLLEAHGDVFDPLYYTERGDLHLANGDINKARNSYKVALQKVQDDPIMTQGIQMRLDTIGSN